MQSLAKIFGSPARLKTIRLFVFNQSIALSSSEVAERARVSVDTARRELLELTAAGFLRKKGEGAKARYQTNPRFAHLQSLDAFIRDTAGVNPKGIVALLRKAGALRLVVLSGLFSNVLESQVDMLIVGDKLDERSLSAAIRVLEAELGREIRYATFSVEDFRYRIGVYDRLVRDVFDYPHRLLVDKIGL